MNFSGGHAINGIRAAKEAGFYLIWGRELRFQKKARILRDSLKALRNYQKARIFLDNLPSYLWIEPTNRCNLRCIMCPTGAGKVTFERGFMDLGLYRKILDDIHPYVSTVILAMSGESLLHPDFSSLVRYAEDRQVKVVLNTNATLLDRGKAQELLDSGLSYVSFAFDGFTKAGYERARRGADFEATLENILGFLMMKKTRGKKKPHTVLSMLDLRLESPSAEEKRVFLRRFRGLVDDVQMREVNSSGCLFKGSGDFSYKVFSRRIPCGRLWNTLSIAWNGDVVPCIYNMNHDYVVGNVGTDSLAAVWNSPKMIALRRAMIEGRPLDISPLCDNCTICGTSKILGIPAGLRASLSDAATNFFGYGFEKRAVGLANLLIGGNFASKRMRAS